MTARPNIRVWGLGHVGLVTAAGLLARGQDVIAIERDRSVVARIERDGGGPSSPSSLRRSVAQGLRSGRLVVHTEAGLVAAKHEVDVICVNAPSNRAGEQSLSSVLEVLDRIDELRGSEYGPHLIVLRTTVVPGTCDRALSPYLNEHAARAARPVSTLVMHPAFVRRCDFERDWQERVVVGATDPDAVGRFARGLALDSRVLTNVDRTSAELVKYVDNALHATKVSFANECGRVAAALGVDSAPILDIVARDRVLNASGAYLEPGAPYAGPCLPKDMRTLVRLIDALGVRAPLLRGTELSNELEALRCGSVRGEADEAVLAAGSA